MLIYPYKLPYTSSRLDISSDRALYQLEDWGYSTELIYSGSDQDYNSREKKIQPEGTPET